MNRYGKLSGVKMAKKKNMIKSSLHFRSSQIGVPLVLIGILMDVFSLYCIVFFRFQRLIGCVCVCVCLLVCLKIGLFRVATRGQLENI